MNVAARRRRAVVGVGRHPQAAHLFEAACLGLLKLCLCEAAIPAG